MQFWLLQVTQSFFVWTPSVLLELPIGLWVFYPNAYVQE